MVDRPQGPAEIHPVHMQTNQQQVEITDNGNTAEAATSGVLKDYGALLRTLIRENDGSNQSIACPSVAEFAIIQGIGKVKQISPVSLQVALTKEGESPTS